MNIKFNRYRKTYFVLTLLLILGSIASLFVFKLRFGIDFTGGTIIELEYQNNRPSNQKISEMLSPLNLGEFNIQPIEDKGIVLRMKEIDSDTHQKILEKLKEGNQVEEQNFELIGPVIGKELKDKTITFIILSIIAIGIYIAIAFHNLSWPIPSWQYGIASLLILVHDVLIPLGVFTILGKYYGVQITIPVVAALLTVIGYAINNVVVVYDRLRENILRFRFKNESFEDTADNAINQTLSRQINTSLVTLLPLIFIFFLGGETLKYFALALILGIVAGLYSSIFLAIPLIVEWNKFRQRKTLTNQGKRA